MKKIAIIIFLLIILTTNVLGISGDFEKMINIIGINKYNNQGYEINEQIYYKYNQIVYGDPEAAIEEPTQRWKNVSNGKWTRNNINGEYRLLGYNYSGDPINNHQFPEDIIPSSSPEDWTYVEINNAVSSWNNVNLYKFVEQKIYMQNTNLIRNNIQYNLNCLKIGLNKTRVESYSTLNNNGTIYTNRLDPYGKKWEATFLTKPMDTEIKYIVNIDTEKDVYVIEKDKQYVEIPVKINTELQSDSELISDKFIKATYNEIYIDEELEKETTTNSKLKNSQMVNLKIDRHKFNNIVGKYTLDLKLISKTYTQFKEDVPFNGKDNKKITLIIEKSDEIVENQDNEEKTENEEKDEIENDDDEDDEENEEDTFIRNNKIILCKKEIINNITKYKELYRTNSTNIANSQGFICAGNILGIKVKTNKNTYKVKMNILGDNSIREFDDLTKRFEWDEPNKRGDKTTYTKLKRYYDFYNTNSYDLNPEYSTINKNNVYLLEFLIPYNTKQTLHSWNSIREQTGKSLSIDENMLMDRIEEAYTLKFDIYNLIKKKNKDGTVTTYTQIKTEYIKFDVFERWNNLYNRNIIKYVLNKQPLERNYNSWVAYE